MMALKKRSASRYSFCCRMCQVWQAQPKTAHNHHHNKKKKQAKQVIKIYNWHDRKSRQASRTRIAPRFFFFKKKTIPYPGAPRCVGFCPGTPIPISCRLDDPNEKADASPSHPLDGRGLKHPGVLNSSLKSARTKHW